MKEIRVGSEYERVSHTRLKNVNFFLVKLTYRTPHLHNDFEILQVIEGNLKVKTLREEFTIGPGEIALFHPNELHFLQSQEESCILLTIQVAPLFCAPYYPELSGIRFATGNISSCVPFPVLLEMIRLCMNLGYAYYSGQTGFELKCVSDLYRLFWRLVVSVPKTETDTEITAQQTKNEQRLGNIVTYIHQHYMEKITLAEIAQRENLSMTYLSHLFKKEMQMSFQEYVSSLRLEHAALLLRNTSMSLTEICIESGFSECKYLNRHFQKAFHMTPGEYRHTLENERTSLSASHQETVRQYIYSNSQGLEILKKHYHFEPEI